MMNFSFMSIRTPFHVAMNLRDLVGTTSDDMSAKVRRKLVHTSVNGTELYYINILYYYITILFDTISAEKW